MVLLEALSVDCGNVVLEANTKSKEMNNFSKS